MPTSSGAASPRHPHETARTSAPRGSDISDLNAHLDSLQPPKNKHQDLPEPTSESTSAPADGGTGFLDLPPEIRNSIYEYAVVRPEPIRFKAGKARAARQPELTRVNRQIRSECLSIFYGENKFATSDFYSFLKALSLENRKSLQYLYVDYCWRRIDNAVDTLIATINYLRDQKYAVPRIIKTGLRVGQRGNDRRVWVDLQELPEYEQVEDYLIERKKDGKV